MKPIYVFLLGLTVFISCKKEIIQAPAGPQGAMGATGQQGSTGLTGPANEVDPRLFSKWEIIGKSGDLRYLIFASDYSVYELYEQAQYYSHRSINHHTSQISPRQLTLSFSAPKGGLYNYAIQNDTLTLSNTYGMIYAKKSNSTPTPDSWVVPITPLDSIGLSGKSYGDISFDGNVLWVPRSPNYQQITKVNLSTKTISALPITIDYGSVGFAQDNLWLSMTDGRLRKIDRATGDSLGQSPLLGNSTHLGITFDGTYIICLYQSDGNANASVYNPLSNTVIKTIPAPYATGIEYAHDFIYMCEGSFIYKCALPSFEAVTTYRITHANNLTGIAYDGANFWVKDQLGYGANDGTELYKVHLD